MRQEESCPPRPGSHILLRRSLVLTWTLELLRLETVGCLGDMLPPCQVQCGNSITTRNNFRPRTETPASRILNKNYLLWAGCQCCSKHAAHTARELAKNADSQAPAHLGVSRGLGRGLAWSFLRLLIVLLGMKPSEPTLVHPHWTPRFSTCRKVATFAASEPSVTVAGTSMFVLADTARPAAEGRQGLRDRPHSEGQPFVAHILLLLA